MRRNIDAWWPFIEQGIEAILVTASGCGAVVKDYGHLLSHDPVYADKARRVSALARDIAEVNQSANQMNTNSGDLNSNAKHLNKLSEKMMDMVAQFKLHT